MRAPRPGSMTGEQSSSLGGIGVLHPGGSVNNFATLLDVPAGGLGMGGEYGHRSLPMPGGLPEGAPMRRTPLLAAVAAGAALAVAVPAAADDYIPIFNPQRVYVHCGTAAKVVVDGSAAPYAWNTTAPASSFTANGGCGMLDTVLRTGDGVTYSGSHTGNLDKLTVHAWVIDAGPVRAGVFPTIWTDVSVKIDGVLVASGAELELTPIPSSTGLARRLDLSVVGIGLLDEDQAGSHTVEIGLESSNITDGDHAGWVLDATEVDSGVSFSPAALADVILDASPDEG